MDDKQNNSSAPTKIDVKTGRQTLKYFWKVAKLNKIRILASFLLSPLATLFDSFLCTWLLSQIINEVSTKETPINQLWSVFGFRVILYLGLMIFTKIFLWRFIVFNAWTFNTKNIYGLYNLVFTNLQQKSINFYNNRFAGSLVSQANRFIDSYNILSNELLWGIIPTLTVITFTILFLMPVLPTYTIILILCSILWATTSYIFSSRIAKVSNQVSSKYNKISGQLSDATTNINSIKSNAKENYEEQRLKMSNDELASANKAEMWAFTKRDIIYGFIMVIMASGLLFTVVTAHALFNAMVGPLVLAVTYSMQLLDYLWRINQTFMNLNRSFGNAKEMTEILNLEPEIKDKDQAYNLNVQAGEIQFKNVNFSYRGKKPQKVFTNFNLTIKPGEKVGIVGHSGGGKSTFTKLLMRYYDLDSGQILIDGSATADVTQESLRQSIAYVAQEPVLFHRTIAENICYGVPKQYINHRALKNVIYSTDVTDDKGVQTLIWAAHQANSVEFIDKLPDGFQTMAGEKGVKLSGGQRQRIAIAQAIAKNSPIIVLDEATSALDTLSEKLIQDAMSRLMAGKTAIVIAHRLSTVSSLDRIVVIDNGEIVEDGNHFDLIKKGGLYAQLWKTQTEA
ncbi:MAG: ABC transporter ATP-binding protein/permease [Bifidobacteriaceae bacterium]|jgi:ATP-binding cassette subfamily B protein|nr:ABC transporter ATP-binding protein/permease [Bifidobacteriaceae bacterium]